MIYNFITMYLKPKIYVNPNTFRILMLNQPKIYLKKYNLQYFHLIQLLGLLKNNHQN